MSGTFLNSGVIFTLARKAFESANSSCDGGNDFVQDLSPLIAIIFSVTAAETFFNEIICMADSNLNSEPVAVKNVRYILVEAERAKCRTLMKYKLGKFALTNVFCAEGSNPYQDFALLIKLRNTIAHAENDTIEHIAPNNFKIIPPRIIDALRSKNILLASGAPLFSSWLSLISTSASAKWACNTVANVVIDFTNAIPASDLRNKANLLVSNSFKTIN